MNNVLTDERRLAKFWRYKGPPLTPMHPLEYERMYRSESALWWYVGLRDFLSGEMERITKADGRPEILDVGCGTGINLQMLGKFGEATGLDFSADALHFCRLRGLENVARGSALALPFEDSSFDVVSCLDVLGHSAITSDVDALSEMYRVLRPGGHVIVHVAALEALRGQHDEVINFSRRYSREQLREAICSSGLRVRELGFRNAFFFPALLLHRQLSRLTRPAQTEAQSDVKVPNRVINTVMTSFAKLETKLLRHVRLPIGSSLYCIAERPY